MVERSHTDSQELYISTCATSLCLGLHTDCPHLAQETLDQLQRASHIMSGMSAISGLTYHGRLGFKAAGMGLSVGPDHAVDTELSIVWEASKVPSISPVLHRLTCMLIRVLIGMITCKPWICWHAFKLNRKPGRLLPSHFLNYHVWAQIGNHRHIEF